MHVGTVQVRGDRNRYGERPPDADRPRPDHPATRVATHNYFTRGFGVLLLARFG